MLHRSSCCARRAAKRERQRYADEARHDHDRGRQHPRGHGGAFKGRLERARGARWRCARKYDALAERMLLSNPLLAKVAGTRSWRCWTSSKPRSPSSSSSRSSTSARGRSRAASSSATAGRAGPPDALALIKDEKEEAERKEGVAERR